MLNSMRSVRLVSRTWPGRWGSAWYFIRPTPSTRPTPSSRGVFRVSSAHRLPSGDADDSTPCWRAPSRDGLGSWSNPSRDGLMRASPQPEEGQDGQNDDDQPDDVHDVVHERSRS